MHSFRLVLLVIWSVPAAAAGQPAPVSQPAPVFNCTISSDKIIVKSDTPASAGQKCTATCQWVTDQGEAGETKCDKAATAGSPIICETANSSSATAVVALSQSCAKTQ